MKAPTMTIRVEPELRHAIKALAEATDRTEAGVVKAAVAAYLEANAWHAEAIQRALDDVRAGTADARALDQDELEARWEDRLARSLA
jgi:predicted transcriptional regulator